MVMNPALEYLEEQRKKRRTPSQVASDSVKEKQSQYNPALEYLEEQRKKRAVKQEVSQPKPEVKPQPVEEKKNLGQKVVSGIKSVGKALFGGGEYNDPKAELMADYNIDDTQANEFIQSVSQSSEENKKKLATALYDLSSMASSELEGMNPVNFTKDSVLPYNGGTYDINKQKTWNEKESEIQMLKETQEIYDKFLGVQKTDQGLIPAIIGNLKKDPKNIIPFNQMSRHVQKQVTTKRALDKLESGVELTSKEKTAVARTQSEVLQGSIKTGLADQVGTMMVDMIPYAITFGMSTPIEAGVTSLVGKQIGVKVGEKTVGNIAKSIVAKSIGLAAQTSTAFAPQIAGDTAKYMLPNYAILGDDNGKLAIESAGGEDGLTKALGKAWLVNYIEVASERAGELISPVAGAITKKLNPFIPQAILSKFASLNGITKPSQLNKLLERIGWDGVVSEVFEEEIAEVLQAPVEERDYYAPFITKEGTERLLVETLGIGAFGGLAKTINLANNVLDRNGKPKMKPIEIPVDNSSTQESKAGVPPTMPDVIKDEIKPKTTGQLQAESQRAKGLGLLADFDEAVNAKDYDKAKEVGDKIMTDEKYESYRGGIKPVMDKLPTMKSGEGIDLLMKLKKAEESGDQAQVQAVTDEIRDSYAQEAENKIIHSGKSTLQEIQKRGGVIGSENGIYGKGVYFADPGSSSLETFGDESKQYSIDKSKLKWITLDTNKKEAQFLEEQGFESTDKNSLVKAVTKAGFDGAVITNPDPNIKNTYVVANLEKINELIGAKKPEVKPEKKEVVVPKVSGGKKDDDEEAKKESGDYADKVMKRLSVDKKNFTGYPKEYEDIVAEIDRLDKVVTDTYNDEDQTIRRSAIDKGNELKDKLSDAGLPLPHIARGILEARSMTEKDVMTEVTKSLLPYIERNKTPDNFAKDVKTLGGTLGNFTGFMNVENGVVVADMIDGRKFTFKLLNLYNEGKQNKEPEPVKAEPKNIISQKLNEYYSQQDEEAIGEAWYQVMAQLEVAEAGSRLFDEDGRVTGSLKSTFPQFVPDELRTKKLFDSVMSGISDYTNLVYPPDSQPRKQELFETIIGEIDSIAGTDGYSVIYRYKEQNEQTTTQEEPEEVVSGSDQGSQEAVEKVVADSETIEKELRKVMEGNVPADWWTHVIRKRMVAEKLRLKLVEMEVEEGQIPILVEKYMNLFASEEENTDRVEKSESTKYTVTKAELIPTRAGVEARVISTEEKQLDTSKPSNFSASLKRGGQLYYSNRTKNGYIKITKEGDMYYVFDPNNFVVGGLFENVDTYIENLENRLGTTGIIEEVKEQDATDRPERVSDTGQVQSQEDRGSGQVADGESGSRPAQRLSDVGDGSGREGVTSNGGVKARQKLNEEVVSILEQHNYSTNRSDYSTEEIRKLNAYSGAGGKATAGAEGKGLLSEYYTPDEVVSMVWGGLAKVASKLGVNKATKLLEPSVGTGNLIRRFSNMPSDRDLVLDAYEYQKVSGTIAKIFVPSANIKIGTGTEFNNPGNFETHEHKPNYDVVVGNPPFGDRNSFAKGKGEEPKINRWEEYFIKRGLDNLREGGLLAYIVNSSFMDKAYSYGKQQIAKSGRLVIGLRLPEKVFTDTDIGTDLLIFQKKTTDDKSELESRLDELTVGFYFNNNPDHLLGEVGMRTNKFGKEEKYLSGTIEDAQDRAKKIFDNLQLNISEVETVVVEPVKLGEKPTARPKKIKEPSYSQAVKKGLKKRLPAVIKPDTKKVETIKTQTLAGEKNTVTKEEEDILIKMNVDGSVDYSEKSKEYLNYHRGKYYHDVLYFSGDIYEKLEDLEQDKPEMSEVQYEKQKKGLEEVKPEPLKIKQIVFDPLDRYITKLRVGDQPLIKSFLSWLSYNRKLVSFGVDSWDISRFVLGERARRGTKDKIGFIQQDAYRLFNFYVQNILDQDIQLDIVNQFNREKNSYVTPDYSKIPIQVKNMAKYFRGKSFSLSRTQIQGASFLSTKGVGLLAYGVGVGKTHTLLTSTMVAHQRGWNKRPAFIVPLSTISQTWISTIKSMFPDKTIVNLGGLTQPDIKAITKERGSDPKKWVKDGEVVVLTHDGLMRLKLSEDELYSAVSDLSDVLTRESSKRGEEKQVEKFNTIVGLAQSSATIPISDLGIDHISVDEVHNFRKVFQGAKPEDEEDKEFGGSKKRFGNVIGGTPSKRAQQLFLISQYILKKNGNRGVLLASATPFENHATEVYNILSLVARDRLRKMGIANINDFYSAFSQFDLELEKDTRGEFKYKQKMKSFKNLGQLQKLIREFIDYREDPALVRPKRLVITPHLQMSEEQELVLTKIQDMLVPPDGRKEEDGAVLKATTYSVANSISPYFIKEYFPNMVSGDALVNNSPKIKYSIELIRSLRKNPKTKEYGTFLYFGANGVDYFSILRDWMVKNLGFKSGEVQYISGQTSVDDREAIKEDFNKGKIKVLIGGDPTKEGIDLQKNGYTTINLALGWNPTEPAQVEGRVWRQGNARNIAPLVYPLLENSGDITIYNKFEEKGSRINDLFSYRGQVFDVGELDPREKKLALMTKPEDKAKLDIEIDRIVAQNKVSMLESEIVSFEGLQKDLRDIPEKIKEYEGYIKTKKYTYGGTISDETIESYKKEVAKMKRRIKQVREYMEQNEILDFVTKIEELKAEVVKAKAEVEEINNTFEDRLAKFQSEYEDMIAKRKSVDQHVADFFERTKNLEEYTQAQLDQKKAELIAELEAEEREYITPSGMATVADFALKRKKVELDEDIIKKYPVAQFPELLRMYKTISGNDAVLGRMRAAIGKFYSEKMKIKLSPDIFKDPALVRAVMAHEIGHMFDFLPDKTLSRGNLVGRIATLHHHMQKMYEELNNKTIRAELKALTMKWRPFNDTKNESFTKYRYSSKELYADAISVLLNDPVMLKREAPTFWAGFFDYLNRKPEVEQNLVELWNLLNQGEEAVRKQRHEDVREMFDTGEQIILNKYQDKINKKRDYSLELRTELIDKNTAVIDKLKKQKKEGRAVSDEENPEYMLEEDNYLAGYIKAWVEENIDPLKKETEQAGLEWEDLGEALLLERIINERGAVENVIKHIELNAPETYLSIQKDLPEKFDTRSNTDQLAWLKKKYENVFDVNGRSMLSDILSTLPMGIANPKGLDVKTATEQLDYLKEILGEKYESLQKILTKYRSIMAEVVKEAEKEGFYKPDLIQQMKANPAYATFAVLDYLELNIPASIKHQIGTLKDVANPATATVIKNISILRAIERNKTKKGVVKWLLKDHSGEITEARYTMHNEYRVPIEPKDSDLGLFTVIENGKVKGFYIDKYIAQTMNSMGTGQISAAVGVLRFFNGKLSRPLFITFNLGFQSLNFVRDFMRFYKNTPGLSFGRAMILYIQALPPAIARGFGLNNKLITQMEKEKILNVTYNEIIKGQTDQGKQIDLIMSQAGVTGSKFKNYIKKTHPVLIAPKATLDFIEATGNTIETIPKVAGYKYLSSKPQLMSKQEMKHFIRTSVGSPDWFRRGTGYWWYNEVFLFSNSIKEGIRADIAVATNPKTASGFWWKTAITTFLPKIMMMAVLMGLFGDDERDKMQGVSEYDKTNYVVVPMGLDENGLTVYARIPQDESSRVLGGMLWKIMSIVEEKRLPNLSDARDLASYAGGQLPGLSPIIGIVTSTFEYLTGQNPYDSFRGRNVIPDDEFEAGGMAAFKPFAMWQLNNMGAGVVMRSYYSSYAPDEKTKLQKILESPIISNVVGRWIKVSDYGKTEMNRELLEGVQKEKAIKRLDEKSQLKSAVTEYRKSGKTEDDAKRIEAQLIQDVLGDPAGNPDYKTQRNALSKKFRVSRVRGEVDADINSVIGATTLDEKVTLLLNMEKTRGTEEVDKIIMDLRKQNIVSVELLKKYKKAQHERDN